MPFRPMLGSFVSSQRPLFSLANHVWNPPTDIYDIGETTVIKMEVAGLDEEQLQVIAQRNVLIIRGRRQQAEDASPKLHYHLMEIHYGEFERAFAFSFQLDQSTVKATYDRGFLVVEVGHSQPQVTRISVQIIGEHP